MGVHCSSRLMSLSEIQVKNVFHCVLSVYIDEVVLDVASELNMEDTLFVRTPLSCSEVSVHSETSKYTDSSRSTVRTPEDYHIKDEHPRASQV